MNSGWRIIDCSSLDGELHYRRGRLVIRTKGADEEVSVPLAQIAVVLAGTHVRLSCSVLMKLSEYGAALMVCNWQGIPIAGAAPISNHSRIGARHQAQARMSRPKVKQAWSAIIRAKVEGQCNVAEALLGLPNPKLRHLSRSVRSGDPDNIEAQAAKYYWAQIGKPFGFLRMPGTGSDPLNSALDYGYTLVRGSVIKAIAAAGLAGALGVFHHGRGNAFALADDLMEPFRPMVDQLVFSHADKWETFDRTQKLELSSLFTRAFDNQGQTLPTVALDFAQRFGQYVEGDIEKLNVPVWEGNLRDAEG